MIILRFRTWWITRQPTLNRYRGRMLVTEIGKIRLPLSSTLSLRHEGPKNVSFLSSKFKDSRYQNLLYPLKTISYAPYHMLHILCSTLYGPYEMEEYMWYWVIPVTEFAEDEWICPNGDHVSLPRLKFVWPE